MKHLIVILSESVPPETKGNAIQRHSGGTWIEEESYMNIFHDSHGIDMFKEIKKMLKRRN